MKRIYVIAILYNVSVLSAAVEDTYAKIFGGQDASRWYRDTVTQALNDFGHAHPQGVQVKKMNALAPLCVGQDLYSFSMFNIWFDEELLDRIDESERLFVVYHEAAHITHKHHQYFLLSLIPLGALALCIPAIHTKMFGQQACPIRYAVYLLWYVLGSRAAYKGYLQPLVKSQEKTADIEAARILYAIGRQDVVDGHIALLKLMISLGYHESGSWHYDLSDQLAYLRKYQSREA